MRRNRENGERIVEKEAIDGDFSPVLHIAHPTKLSRGSDPLIFSHQPASLFSPPCLKILHSIGEWLVL